MPALIAALMPVTIHWTARPVVSAPVSAMTNRCREVARSQRLPFTREGIENLKELIEIHKANPDIIASYRPSRS